jgi:hypothetical protein
LPSLLPREESLSLQLIWKNPNLRVRRFAVREGVGRCFERYRNFLEDRRFPSGFGIIGTINGQVHIVFCFEFTAVMRTGGARDLKCLVVK